MNWNIKKNLLFLILDKIILMLGGFAINIAIYRVLEPASAGKLSIALSFWSLFGFLLSMGLDSISVKYLVIYSKNRLKILKAIFFIRILGAFFAFLLANILVYMYTSDYEVILLVFINSLLFVFSPFLILDSYFQSLNNSRLAAKYRMLSKVIVIIYNMILVMSTKNLILFCVSNVLFNLIISVCYWFEFKKIEPSASFKRMFSTFDIRVVRLLFLKGLPLILAAIAIPIFMQSDVLMINSLMGPYSSGLYSAAVKLTLPFVQVLSVISIVFFPMLLAIKKNDIFDSTYISISSCLLWITVISSLVVSYFSTDIVAILYGSKYSGTAEILQVQIWTTVVILMGPLGSKWLMVKGLLGFEFYKTASAALINIILNYYFINEFGVIGASYASLVSYLVANVLFFMFFRKTRKLIKLQIMSLNPLQVFKFTKLLKL